MILAPRAGVGPGCICLSEAGALTFTPLRKQPWQCNGIEETGPSFRPNRAESRKLANFSVFSDGQGKFSVFSQAVERFATACQRSLRSQVQRRQFKVQDPGTPFDFQLGLALLG
jgi:hypothetical protein